MKVLTIADTILSSQSLKQIIEAQKPDVIITLGDLKQNWLLDLIRINDIPKIGIYGNHCQELYLNDPDFGIKNIHLKNNQIHNLNFYGFEGCVFYKNDNYHYSQEDCQKLFNPLVDTDIIISHCSPQGINDNNLSKTHQGFNSFSSFIKSNNKRKIWFHGHSYPLESQKISVCNNTIIIHCYGIEVFELDELHENFNKYPIACSYSR